jgi:hypothetical protein
MTLDTLLLSSLRISHTVPERWNLLPSSSSNNSSQFVTDLVFPLVQHLTHFRQVASWNTVLGPVLLPSYIVFQSNAIHSFIHQWLYNPLLGRGLLFCFVISFTQTIGPFGRRIGPSQGRYLNTGQHKHRINAHTDIHALNGILTHEPSVRASKGS